jgi:hypothetical protein
VIEAVCRKARCLILSGDLIAPFTNLFDLDGEETDDLELAIVAVAFHPDGSGWFTIVFDDWAEQTFH